jgi:transcription elongation factor Elf1
MIQHLQKECPHCAQEVLLDARTDGGSSIFCSYCGKNFTCEESNALPRLKNIRDELNELRARVEALENK